MTEEQKVLVEQLETKIERMENNLRSTGYEISEIKQLVGEIKTKFDVPQQSVPETIQTEPIHSSVNQAANPALVSTYRKPETKQEPQPILKDHSVEEAKREKVVPKQYYRQSVGSSKGIDFETLLGKNTMAVGASILTFIALVLFARVIAYYLTDEIKMALMFLFSFCIVGAGEFYARKEKSNKSWANVLLGVGVGALMISLFVSHAYFKAFNIYVLYGLMTAVTLYISYLDKKRSIIFAVIGQLGVIISLLFGLSEIGEEYGYIITIILMLVMESPFLISDVIAGKFSNFVVTWLGVNLSFIIFNSVNVITQGIVYRNGAIDAYPIGADWFGFIIGILATFYVTYITRKFTKTPREKTVHIYLVLVNTFLIGCGVFAYVYNNELSSDIRNYFWIVAIALFEFVLFYIDRYKESDDTARNVFVGILMLLAYTRLFTNYGYLAMILTTILALIYVAYGYIKENKIFIYSAMAFLLHPLSHFAEKDGIRIAELLILVAIFMGYTVLRIKNKKEIDRPVNYIMYFISYIVVIDIFKSLFVVTDNNRDAIKIGLLAVFFGIQLVTSILVKKFKDESEYFNYIYVCAHALLMFGSFYVVGTVNGITAYIFASLLMLVIFSINNKMIRGYLRENTGVYIAVKYTVAIWWILKGAYVSGFAFSILFLILAIIAIGFGFAKDDQSVRIYGLVLSMISIAKLILYDVKYTDTAVRALGFLVCGVLCFVISYIYHRIDSKNSKAE